jgi:hypothetical protein
MTSFLFKYTPKIIRECGLYFDEYYPIMYSLTVGRLVFGLDVYSIQYARRFGVEIVWEHGCIKIVVSVYKIILSVSFIVRSKI